MTSTTLRSTRVPVSVLIGSAITLALFWGLQQLISAHGIALPTFKPGPILFKPLTPPHVADPAPRPTKPKPPTPTTTTDTVRVQVVSTTTSNPDPGVPRPSFDFGTTTRIPLPTAPTDHDAAAQVTPQPVYPDWAKTHNVEGWVLVEFTVTAAGAVANPAVVDSEPKGTFDSAVLRAVTGWKYVPRIEDGVAVERPGMRVVLRFDLED